MTEYRGRVIITPASCSEGPGFKSLLGDWLSSLRFFVVFLSPSMQIPVGWKYLHNEELHNLDCSPNIIGLSIQGE
jgi:hypothetical protein